VVQIKLLPAFVTLITRPRHDNVRGTDDRVLLPWVGLPVALRHWGDLRLGLPALLPAIPVGHGSSHDP